MSPLRQLEVVRSARLTALELGHLAAGALAQQPRRGVGMMSLAEHNQEAAWKAEFDRLGEANVRFERSNYKRPFWRDADGKVIPGKFAAAGKWLDDLSATQEKINRRNFWAALIALGVAILSLGVAILAWLRPVSPTG